MGTRPQLEARMMSCPVGTCGLLEKTIPTQMKEGQLAALSGLAIVKADHQGSLLLTSPECWTLPSGSVPPALTH